jgi:hypothetical protein
MIGRLFSFLSILGSFVVLYLLARRLGLPPAWSLCALSVVGELRTLLIYCTSYRPDAPMAFFALLAFWVAARGRATWGTAAAALGCLLVSAWFKLTAWGVGLMVAWWVWRGLGARRALFAGSIFIVAGFVPLGLLDRHWNGFLLLNIIDSLRNGFNLDCFINFFRYTPLIPMLLMAGGALVGGMAAKRRLIWRWKELQTANRLRCNARMGSGSLVKESLTTVAMRCWLELL